MPRRSISTPRRRASSIRRTCGPRCVSGCRGCAGGRCATGWPRSSSSRRRAAGVLHARRQIEERERELVAAGVEVGDSGREAIAHATRGRKRYGIDTAPWRDVVRARAAEHGLGARELAALVLGPARAPEIPDPRRVSVELAGAGGLTERQNTFAKREAVMAWAAAHGQGAPAEAVERAQRSSWRATTCIVPRSRGGSRRAICSPTSTRSCMARRRVAAKQGRLDSALVDTVLANAPLAPTAEQAHVIHGLTSSGHGVETVEALAGTGKTFTAGCSPRPTRPAASASSGRRRRDAPSASSPSRPGSGRRGRLRGWRSTSTPTTAVSGLVGRC